MDLGWHPRPALLGLHVCPSVTLARHTQAGCQILLLLPTLASSLHSLGSLFAFVYCGMAAKATAAVTQGRAVVRTWLLLLTGPGWGCLVGGSEGSPCFTQNGQGGLCCSVLYSAWTILSSKLVGIISVGGGVIYIICIQRLVAPETLKPVSQTLSWLPLLFLTPFCKYASFSSCQLTFFTCWNVTASASRELHGSNSCDQGGLTWLPVYF